MDELLRVLVPSQVDLDDQNEVHLHEGFRVREESVNIAPINKNRIRI